MSPFSDAPPALFPLIGCVVALGSLWAGYRTLRALAIPPLLRPLVGLHGRLGEALKDGEVARPKKAEPPAAETVRVYGWAWIYAGTLLLIIAGGQLVRLIAR